MISGENGEKPLKASMCRRRERVCCRGLVCQWCEVFLDPWGFQEFLRLDAWELKSYSKFKFAFRRLEALRSILELLHLNQPIKTTVKTPKPTPKAFKSLFHFNI
jgi:hypothetical protein